LSDICLSTLFGIKFLKLTEFIIAEEAVPVAIEMHLIIHRPEVSLEKGLVTSRPFDFLPSFIAYESYICFK
jgi:hypothetical protein